LGYSTTTATATTSAASPVSIIIVVIVGWGATMSICDRLVIVNCLGELVMRHFEL
jgi:hypothetical protein